MARILPGRHTHAEPPDGTLTVFLIGMRINRWWRPDAWGPVAAAMGPMIPELSRDPSSGFLGASTTIGRHGPVLIQYWRSPEDLQRYASDRDAKHRPAWTAFNARARRAPGAVGIWHETYQVAAAETLYADMPPFGLGAALGTEEVGAPLNTAAKRLSRGRRI